MRRNHVRIKLVLVAKNGADLFGKNFRDVIVRPIIPSKSSFYSNMASFQNDHFWGAPPTGAATFGLDKLFNIPFNADWNKIEEHRQHQTDLN